MVRRMRQNIWYMIDKKLTLVIATYNRGHKLTVTLDSLLCQTLPADLWEVVVVNNNSTDDTAGRFAEYAAAHPELDVRMVNEMRQGVSAARNRGVAESRGEYIVVIDDDEVVVPRFLEEYYELFESRKDVSAAGGRILSRMESEPPAWMSKYTERAIAGVLDLGDQVTEFPAGKFFGGGNHGFRRSIAERYGGYDVSLGRCGGKLLAGEEKEFFMRLKSGGEKIIYLPDAVIYHLINPERLTRGYFERLCRNIGVSERMRTKSVSPMAYAKRLFAEAIKWGGVAVLSCGYLLRGQPSKAGYLVLMRSRITAGLLTGTSGKY